MSEDQPVECEEASGDEEDEDRLQRDPDAVIALVVAAPVVGRGRPHHPSQATWQAAYRVDYSRSAARKPCRNDQPVECEEASGDEEDEDRLQRDPDAVIALVVAAPVVGRGRPHHPSQATWQAAL
eukprot:CAMPEP_0206235748 /NCGR_PEP_ID=MMETSP0047_2-20121206/13327_1 /ASSEMBLY_ACC=CAM_ASM_000192 /TAXON_ID=195065 /ORGANISM="Chroomonas mesostigmatica_cf, Strain CCMP1168" /LENGTH=124 /DNA_ID=CAMNT_0053659997 /DNA_START=998 /DNA_END=1374 /DNA_ORIENTATION=+